jgi:NAD-dependent dihydropyrimidine dehydrogenase PreA subunit
MSTPLKLTKKPTLSRSTLILGSSTAIQDYTRAMEDFDIEVEALDPLPDKITRSAGQFAVTRKNRTWLATTLVLLPKDDREAESLQSFFEKRSQPTGRTASYEGIDRLRAGAWIVSPACEPAISAAVAAFHVAAWLHSIENQFQPASIVDPSRCRACGTCIEVCEFGAPEIIQYNHLRASWIDPTLCAGCGICAAHCPSGAITAGYSTDAQIDAMLSTILARPV